MQLAQGTVLFNGRYVIKKCIGDGGFGITYLADDKKLDREVVLKEYFPDYMAKRDVTISNEVHTLNEDQESELQVGISKFMKEAKTLALLNKITSIATVYDFFEENNTAYIVMEYIRGKSLKQYIKERKTPYTFDEAMQVLEPCMLALQKVHEAGIIHRDFAPDNILIDDRGQVKIIDFGASREYVSSGPTMTIMVKHGYAPMEQYANTIKQGPYTDVYSLAAILYEMLTLNKPMQSIDRVIIDNLIKPSEINLTVTMAQDEIVMKGLAVIFSSRYQTISEFLSAIKNANNQVTDTQDMGAPIMQPQFQYRTQNEEPQIVGQAAVTELIGHEAATELAKDDYQVQQNIYQVTGSGNGTLQRNEPKDKKSKKGLFIGLICAIIALTACIIVGIVIASNGTSSSTNKANSEDTSSEDTSSKKKKNKKAEEPVATSEVAVTNEVEEEAADDNLVAEPKEIVKIGIVMEEPYISGFRTAMYNDFERVFCEENGYEATFGYGMNSEEKIAAASEIITSGVDYLAISDSWDVSGWEAVFRDARDAGTEVILFDSTLDVDSSLYIASVETSFVREGEIAVEWLLSQNLKEYNVIHFTGSVGSLAQVGRAEALNKAVADGKINIVAEYNPEWSSIEANNDMSNYLLSRGDEGFNVIFADNDSMAMGAMEALDAAGISHGLNQDVIVIGFDCSRDALTKVLRGDMNFDVQDNPFMASYVDDIIRNGAPSDKVIIVDDKGFDAKTITQEDVEKYGL